MAKESIQTKNAPDAIGPYSQAIKAGNTVYLSGQIPLHPDTMELVEGDIRVQAERVFENLRAVCEKSGGQFSDIVKISIYLTDLTNFPTVNEVMETYFEEPYPARATIGVASLPKGAAVEIEAIMVIA